MPGRRLAYKGWALGAGSGGRTRKSRRYIKNQAKFNEGHGSVEMEAVVELKEGCSGNSGLTGGLD